MIAHASITLFSQDDNEQTRRETAKARALLRKAGLKVPRNANRCEVDGDVTEVLETTQLVRGVVARGKLQRTTTLVKLGV